MTGTDATTSTSTESASASALDNLLAEDRTFPPPAGLAADANLGEEAYGRAAGRSGGVLAGAGGAVVVGDAVLDGAGLERRAARAVVRGRRR